MLTGTIVNALAVLAGSATGLLLAVLYALRRSKEFGLKEDDILDGVLWVTPFAIACARAYYVAFRWQEYAADPISVLYIWNGGIAIYGGVIGAIIGITGALVPGIAIGVAGLGMALLTYPIYKGILNTRKKKYGAEILALSEKIMNK